MVAKQFKKTKTVCQYGREAANAYFFQNCQNYFVGLNHFFFKKTLSISFDFVKVPVQMFIRARLQFSSLVPSASQWGGGADGGAHTALSSS